MKKLFVLLSVVMMTAVVVGVSLPAAARFPLSQARATPHPARLPVGAFNPDGISGLIAWYNADVSAFQNFALTTPATDGSTVRALQDVSAHNRGTLKANSDTPTVVNITFNATGLNGHGTLTFNNEANGLGINDATVVSQPSTVFVVWKPTSAGGNVFDCYDGSNRWTIERFGGNHVQYAGSVVTGGALTLGTWLYTSAIFNGASSGLWKNGVADPGSPVNAGAGACNGIRVGTGFDGIYSGDIAEVLVYNVALSTSDRQSVESYLAAKYGI